MSTTKAHPTDMNALVRSLREVCGLTQEQFATQVGVSLVTINRWENNRAQPMPLAVQQIKALLMKLSQSENDADQLAAHQLLKQYFPKETNP